MTRGAGIVREERFTSSNLCTPPAPLTSVVAQFRLASLAVAPPSIETVFLRRLVHAWRAGPCNTRNSGLSNTVIRVAAGAELRDLELA